MRLTTRTNLAIRALMYCAVHRARVTRSAEIARACNSSANHLAQVVHTLHANGFLHTTRGRLGGVSLARAPASINIGEVFRLFEADTPSAECFQPETNTCPLTPACRLQAAIGQALDAFYQALDGVTLEDLVGGNSALEALLQGADGEGRALRPGTTDRLTGAGGAGRSSGDDAASLPPCLRRHPGP